MLDLKLLRDHPDEVAARLATKVGPVDLQPLLDLDAERRRIIAAVEDLRKVRNQTSKDIGRRRQAGEDMAVLQAEVRGIGDRIQALDDRLREVEAEQEQRLLVLPNLPHASVPVGEGAAQNRVVRTVGEPKTFAFPVQAHWDLGTRLGILNFERAAKLSGSGFPVFIGAGARLVRGLIQFMLDLHTTRHGYTEVAPPVLLNAAAMTGTGQLPKMEEDMYRLERDGLYLAPTAEVPVTNLFREEILDRPLPIKLTAYTPCFRREAGSAGKDTRGLIRLHQFDKVELVKFVDPQTSYAELESLRGDAEAVLKALGLTYRVLELCTGDLSFAAAKCYDLELWAPGVGAWLEVSSCSNFEDFQARRAGIRYRDADGKPRFVHTLNGSGVALPRLIIALLENGQQEDGSVALPEALHPYLGGLQVLRPA